MIAKKGAPKAKQPAKLDIKYPAVQRMSQDMINLAIFAFDDAVVGSTAARPIKGGKNDCGSYEIIPHHKYGMPGEIDYRIFRTIEHSILERFTTEEVPSIIPLGSSHDLLMTSLGYTNEDRYRSLEVFAERLTRLKISYVLENETIYRGRIRKHKMTGSNGIFQWFYFAGDVLEDGTVADQMYLKLTDEYRKSLEASRFKLAYKSVVDGIRGLAQKRMYELILSRDKYGAPIFSYPEVCQYLHVQQYKHLSKIVRHLDRLLGPLKMINLEGQQVPLIGEWHWLVKGLTFAIPMAIGHSPLLTKEAEQVVIKARILEDTIVLTQVGTFIGEARLAITGRDEATTKLRKGKLKDRKAARDRQVGEYIEEVHPDMYGKALAASDKQVFARV